MLLQSQRFVLENIYCAPAQDRQYTFKMARLNKKTFPVLRQVVLYGATKMLPNATSYFQVFTIGNLFPEFLNLQGQTEQWMRDRWIKMSEDMVARNFIAKVYNDEGMVFPRQNVYYSFIDENSLVIALEITPYNKQHFDVGSYEFLNIYSNAYFQSAEFAALPIRKGIDYYTKAVENNQEKAQLQTLVTSLKTNGGDVFVYVDGAFVDRITLNIPDHSFVEIVYDQSVVSRQNFDIQGLRTFDSVKDNKMKYLLYRDKVRDTLEYQDDTEVYITQKNTGLNTGLLLYRHQDYAMRNVTDKDYSLHTTFVNNTAQALSQKVGGNLNDKVITLYIRQGGRARQLVYNAMKLHELYKLPFEVQRDVLSNTNYTVDIYRAEQLENSAYFQCASADGVNKITPQTAIEAIGYNGMTHYYADTPVLTQGALTINVPGLYQTDTLAFEYDVNGLYLRTVVSDGPLYTCTDSSVAMVDFMAGHLPVNYGVLYAPEIVIVPEGLEYRVLSAYFDQAVRTSVWEDITDQSAKCQRTETSITVTETQGKRIKLVSLDTPRVYDLALPLTNGSLYFPLTQLEDRGNGMANHVLDVPYKTIEIYLNGNRLVQGLDFFMKFPYISICTKRYLNYTLENQQVHIRMAGFTLDLEEVNQQELNGFVNNGVLTRNRHYDIRDDRVFSVFVDGKLKPRQAVRYAETDNTVRVNASCNGLSYTLKEPFIAIKRLTGVDSFPLYQKNLLVNKKISDLYDLVYPEPAINEFNAISGAHYLFSPLVSSLLTDLKQGVIPASFYTSPYDDTAILQLIDQNYKTLFLLDPIRANLQRTLVEIHPHLGNSPIALDLLQYRFIQNVIRVITGNHPEIINLSGYVTLSS